MSALILAVVVLALALAIAPWLRRHLPSPNPRPTTLWLTITTQPRITVTAPHGWTLAHFSNGSLTHHVMRQPVATETGGNDGLG
jgi:hypothetical protein